MNGRMKQAIMNATKNILKMSSEEFLSECAKHKDGDIATFLKMSGRFNITPSEAKEKIHKQYDEEVKEVLAGKAGYIPCKKSPLSKSCSGKFPSVEFGVMCPTCKDTKEVENPLTGELHFYPICGEN